MGLSNERRRCSADAVNTTRYCEQHQANTATGEIARTLNAADSRNIFRFIRTSTTANSIPDNARFALPSKLKRGTTNFIIDELLHNPSPMIRWSAAFALRKRRDPIAIEPLWQALNDDPVSFVRQQSAVALGKIGTAMVVAPLVQALWHDIDAGVRQACAIALGNLGNASAVTEIAHALEREHSGFVRWDCILAIGQLGNNENIPLLTRLAETENAEALRRACRESIQEILSRQLDSKGF